MGKRARSRVSSSSTDTTVFAVPEPRLCVASLASTGKSCSILLYCASYSKAIA